MKRSQLGGDLVIAMASPRLINHECVSSVIQCCIWKLRLPFWGRIKRQKSVVRTWLRAHIVIQRRDNLKLFGICNA